MSLSKLTATQWNASVRDNILFLANPPACRVYNDAAISVAHNTVQALTFNTERFDPTGMHSTAALTGRITFTTAGLYHVGGGAELAAATDYTHRVIQVRLNGTTTLASINYGPLTDVTIPSHMAISTLYKFAAADYIELTVYHENGAAAARNAAVSANYSPEFWAVWVGLG